MRQDGCTLRHAIAVLGAGLALMVSACGGSSGPSDTVTPVDTSVATDTAIAEDTAIADAGGDTEAQDTQTVDSSTSDSGPADTTEVSDAIADGAGADADSQAPDTPSEDIVPDIEEDTSEPVCGDGQVDPGEACDEGEDNSDTVPDACRLDCSLPTCGDGVTDTGEFCDDGNDDDTDACTAACTEGMGLAKPGPGEVRINELMINPSVVSDPKGEWIELLNTSEEVLNLAGCVLSDAGTDTFTIIGVENALTIEPGGVVVLGFSGDETVNGGVVPNETYSTMLLDNVSDEVVLTCLGNEIDSVIYDKGTFGLVPGAALSRDPLQPDGTGPQAWCLASTQFGAGDYGTPGAVNDACPEPDITVDLCVLTSASELSGFVGTSVEVSLEVLEVGITDTTSGVDADAALVIQVGLGATGADPTTDAFTWTSAAGQEGWANGEGLDGYIGSVSADKTGDYDVAARASRDGGQTWVLCDRGAGSADGYSPADATQFEVLANPCDTALCESPPADVCGEDGVTLLTYPATGTCAPLGPQQTECTYEAIPSSCANEGLLCSDATCQGAIPYPEQHGDIVLTEFLAHSNLPGDLGEWFEYTNPTNKALNLKGCWLSDNSGEGHAIESNLVVLPGKTIVIGRSLDLNANGGVVVNYSVGDAFTLDADGDAINLSCAGIAIDAVNTKEVGGTIPPGVALSLSPFSVDAEANDLAASWCFATDDYAENLYGTPGEKNPLCPVDYNPVDSCTTLPSIVGKDVGAGVTLTFSAMFQEAGITDLTSGTDVEPEVLWAEIGYGPQGSDPESKDWVWLPAHPDLTWDDTNTGSEGMDKYVATLRLPGEGAYSVIFRGTANGGKVYSYCDLDGSQNGLSFEQTIPFDASPSACWPDPCGEPAAEICEENKVMSPIGDAQCALEAEASICTWNQELVSDCTTLGGTCSDGACGDFPANPGEGQLVISELMIVTNAVQPEWIELTNVTDTLFSLQGCTLTSGPGETFAFGAEPAAELLVPAQGTVVMVRSGLAAIPDNLPHQLTYEGIALANSQDVVTISCGETTIDTVAYTGDWALPLFMTLSLSADATDAVANDAADNWCSGTFKDGLVGTPGAVNPLCGDTP